MNTRSMEIVQEGRLESISRPSSSGSRQNCSLEHPTKSVGNSASFQMELLPAEGLMCSVTVDDSMALEDVADNTSDIEEDYCHEEGTSVRTSPITQKSDHQTKENDVSSAENESESPTDESEKVDPKITKGLLRIKKLDSLLEQAEKKEKDVKEERRRTEKELRLQLRSLLEEKHVVSKKVGQQLLALCEADENEISNQQISRDSSAVPGSPLFPTQVYLDMDENFDDFQQTTVCGLDASPLQDVKRVKGTESISDDQEIMQVGNTFKHSKEKRGKASKSSKKGKQRNFIDRNIKLASHANEIVALTEEERKRLDELLCDESDLFLAENPYSSGPLMPRSQGYAYDEESSMALLRIDEQLKELIPEEEFDSVCSTARSQAVSDNLTWNESNLNSVDDCESSRSPSNNLDRSKATLSPSSEGLQTEPQTCGEKTLEEKRQFREMQKRLAHVERELKEFKLQEEAFEYSSETISKELLRQLLDVDSRSTSSAISIKEVVSERCSTAESAFSSLASDMGGLELEAIPELETNNGENFTS